MEMIRRMSIDMEEVMKKHEEEREVLQALWDEDALIRKHMNSKGSTPSTPTQPRSHKQSCAKPKQTV